MNVTGECSPSLLANLPPSSVFLASCGQQSMYFNRFSTNLFFFSVKMSAEANCRRKPMRLCSPMCRDLLLCREGSSNPPPDIFRFELNSTTKVEFCLLKWTAVNESNSFQVLSSVLLCNWNCEKEALKYLLIFHQNRQKKNGSKCTNDNP